MFFTNVRESLYKLNYSIELFLRTRKEDNLGEESVYLEGQGVQQGDLQIDIEENCCAKTQPKRSPKRQSFCNSF